MRLMAIAVAAVAVLAAITVWGPGWLIAIAWGLVALALMGAGMNRSPAVQLRGRVNRVDPTDRGPDVKRP
jgi:hypothetical protein